MFKTLPTRFADAPTRRRGPAARQLLRGCLWLVGCLGLTCCGWVAGAERSMLVADGDCVSTEGDCMGADACVCAGECACDGECACECVTKVYCLVREDRKVSVTCWGFQDEDLLILRRSTPCRRCADVVCDDCDETGAGKDAVKAVGKDDGKGGVCSAPKRFSWIEWEPGACPRIFVKRKLMKRTVVKKVPSFKWVLQDAEPDAAKGRP